jgi:hypothetical protein
MRIKQAIIPAILALSAAGSILVGSAAPAVFMQAPAAVVAVSAQHGVMYLHE